MKKLFTLVALLTCFLGAKAEWVEDYKLDYSSKTAFPWYVMGYVTEWVDGIMVDYGANYKYVTVDNEDGETSDVIVKTASGVEYYKIALESPGWHQYNMSDGFSTEVGLTYVVKAMVKASASCDVNINFQWGWGDGERVSATATIPESEDFVEVEWTFPEVAGSNCSLICQPGTATATIEWKSIVVGHEQKAQRPVIWQEWLTNDGNSIIPDVDHTNFWMGDAETPWADPNVKFNDQTQNYLICAWSKEREVNMNDDGGWDPFPATIEAEEGNESNHIFVCHGKAATTDGDAAAWDNQFWIQSPKAWKSGTQVKVKFRYKASKNVTTQTQIHKQNPSDYLHWQAIGDVAFTTEWQDFEKTFTFADAMDNGWSIAFNLNANDKDAIDFYFDDLSWQTMKLDEGLYMASSNTVTGIEYDFDNATEFVYNEEQAAYEAVAGIKGKKDTWVNELMISTVRGQDAAFKGATLKPSGTYIGEDNWGEYMEANLAKIKLPAAGVWKVLLDTANKQINITKIEGDEEVDPLEEVPNTTEVVVKGQERDFTAEEQPADEEQGIAAGTGQPWDNQFFIVANRPLSKGEETIIKFKYKASVEGATSGTQLHGDPGAYMHYDAIGSFSFTTEYQTFEKTLTIPEQADGMKSIAFNMAEIKGACDYYITDVVWMTADKTETLIDTEGAKNFYVKEGAGTAIYIFGTKTEVKGDLNGDGIVNALDIQVIINAAIAEDNSFDQTGDGICNALDIQTIINIAAATE